LDKPASDLTEIGFAALVNEAVFYSEDKQFPWTGKCRNRLFTAGLKKKPAQGGQRRGVG
jgi:hypothetical protein